MGCKCRHLIYLPAVRFRREHPLSFPIVGLARCLAAVALLLSCNAGAALADDYKEATERAYCAGVHKASIADTKEFFGGSVDTRGTELKEFERHRVRRRRDPAADHRRQHRIKNDAGGVC